MTTELLTSELVQQACLAYGPQALPARMRAALGVLEERCNAQIAAAELEAAEARHDLEVEMGERNVRQSELDDIATLLGVGLDAPYMAVRRGVERLREALSEALEAMVHRPVDSELFLSAIAHASAVLGIEEDPAND